MSHQLFHLQNMLTKRAMAFRVWGIPLILGKFFMRFYAFITGMDSFGAMNLENAPINMPMLATLDYDLCSHHLEFYKCFHPPFLITKNTDCNYMALHKRACTYCTLTLFLTYKTRCISLYKIIYQTMEFHGHWNNLCD